MLKLLAYVVKTLWRQRTRSLLTAGGTAVALFVFSFVGAVDRGLSQWGDSAVGGATLIVFQAHRFCPATSRLPADYAATIARLPGVADVRPIQVFTNNCRASLDAVVFHGMPAEQLRRGRALRVIAGAWGDFESRSDAALVGRGIALRRNLRPGQRFTIGPISVHVAAIVAADQPAQEHVVYTHLAFLQRTPGLHAAGRVTQFEVELTPGADAVQTAGAIDAAFRGGPVATDTRSQAEFARTTLADIVQSLAMLRLVGAACVGLVLVLVATTTVMTVQDRVGEHALLQVLGFSPLRVFGLVIAESTLVSLVGGGGGIAAAAAVLGRASLALGAEAISVAIEPSWGLAAAGLGVTLAVGAAAGLLPAWHAARAEIVAALRPL